MKVKLDKHKQKILFGLLSVTLVSAFENNDELMKKKIKRLINKFTGNNEEPNLKKYEITSLKSLLATFLKMKPEQINETDKPFISNEDESNINECILIFEEVLTKPVEKIHLYE